MNLAGPSTGSAERARGRVPRVRVQKLHIDHVIRTERAEGYRGSQGYRQSDTESNKLVYIAQLAVCSLLLRLCH